MEKKTRADRLVPNLIVERSKTAQEGFSLAQDFFDRIRTEYPDFGYPGRKTMDAFNPNNIERSAQRTAITYAARVNNLVVGVLTGEEITGEEEGEEDPLIYKGQTLIVDPKFQNTNVIENLLTQARSYYETVMMTPVLMGGKRRPSTSRVEVLRRYYRKLGFKDRPRENTMIWRKEKDKDV